MMQRTWFGEDRGELGSTQEQPGGVFPGLIGDRWPKECPWLLKSSAESPGPQLPSLDAQGTCCIQASLSAIITEWGELMALHP